MQAQLDYKVNPKENLYFVIRLIISLGLYALLLKFIVEISQNFDTKMMSVYVFLFYALLIFVYLFFRLGVLIGYLKGNAVKLSRNQFPEIYHIVAKQAEQLHLRSVPDVYILQSGGVLNAFAARFIGRNYIVLYSEMVEAAMEHDNNIINFVIGHELGHIKRNHMLKNVFLLPSYVIPFLGAAYSRACEYTCDSIGNALSPEGVKNGLLLLASGKTIFKKVNVNEYLLQQYTETGFWKWFAEKVSAHPHLTKRLALYQVAKETAKSHEAIPVVETKVDDYSRYMPN